MPGARRHRPGSRAQLLVALAALALAGGAARAQDFEVEGTLGTLDDASVQLAVQKHAAAIEACFKEQAAGKRYLGGALSLRLRVARDGSVKSAAARSDVGSWDVERCLVKLARTMRFARPRGGEAEVELPLEFPARTQVATADGAELDARLGALAACQGGPPEVQVTAYVGPGGKITSAGFSAEAALSEGWGDCAARKLAGFRLTDPRGRVMKLVGRRGP
jgi:hypothetical protein